MLMIITNPKKSNGNIHRSLPVVLLSRVPAVVLYCAAATVSVVEINPPTQRKGAKMSKRKICRCGATVVLINPAWWNVFKRPRWVCSNKICPVKRKK